MESNRYWLDHSYVFCVKQYSCLTEFLLELSTLLEALHKTLLWLPRRCQLLMMMSRVPYMVIGCWVHLTSYLWILKPHPLCFTPSGRFWQFILLKIQRQSNLTDYAVHAGLKFQVTSLISSWTSLHPLSHHVMAHPLAVQPMAIHPMATHPMAIHPTVHLKPPS